MQHPDPPVAGGCAAQRLVVFFGLTASGKSTLAQAWAVLHKAPYYNTDRVRKELMGLKSSERRPDGIGRGIYTAEMTAKTYQTLCERGLGDLAQGVPLAVLDGSYGRRADRDCLRCAAAAAGVRCIFVLCACGEDETRRRLALRAADPEAVSDGRWEIYLHQKRTFEPPDEHEGDCLHLHTGQRLEELLASLETLLCQRDCRLL